MSQLELKQEFERRFSAPPEYIVRAPGRVNLIGEHTDYNGGFVLPMAIDREVRIAGRRRAGRTVRMVALDFGGDESILALDDIARDDAHAWSNYPRGIALMLQKLGAPLSGLDLLIHGNVPIGSGLSSSAAIEVAAATAFLVLSGFRLGGVEIAQLCQRADNEFVGVKSGIMDQFISALGRAGDALLIDCRDLSYEYVPVPHGAAIVVCDTMKRRGLVSSEYNTRRAECEEAARLLGVPLLRDVSVATLAARAEELPPVVAARARHVVTEDARVLEAVAAMRRDDLTALGELMDASHASLRDDYGVSSPELNAMVEVARAQPGCLGARLTGAGFGGCTVNLVRNDAVPAFVANVAAGYQARTGLVPQIYPCQASAGAGLIEQ